jgi:hypothetical protein
MTADLRHTKRFWNAMHGLQLHIQIKGRCPFRLVKAWIVTILGYRGVFQADGKILVRRNSAVAEPC